MKASVSVATLRRHETQWRAGIQAWSTWLLLSAAHGEIGAAREAFLLMEGKGGFRLPVGPTEGVPLKHVHPELEPTMVRCLSCGNVFTTRSTRSEILIEVCANCHPAYRGH